MLPEGRAYSLRFVHPSIRTSVRAPFWFLLSNLMSFHPIFTKLTENVHYHKMEAKFDNQQNPFRHYGVIALEFLTKTGLHSGFRSLA
jgi:hypothetical protein